MNTIAILGGGASGLAAAIAARERLDNTVIVLERQARVGKKLLATGNGRCNLTNENACAEHYHGADVDFMTPAMRRFGTAETLRWFASLGLAVRTEPGGRVYPLSDTAGSVVDTLRLAADAAGAQLRCGFDAAGVSVRKGKFIVTPFEGEPVTADRLIVACGGMAGSKLGGTETGYTLLGQLGHRRTKLYPSLTQVTTENTYTRALKGVRTQAVVTLERRGTVLARSSGEVQFADYGLTGPAVFDISRAAAQCGGGCEIVLRLLPELDTDAVADYIREKQSRFPNYRAENLFTGLLHNSIARVLLRRSDIRQDAFLWSLTQDQLDALAGLIARFPLPLQGVHGFADAQVTAGGVETSGFDPETMASRLVPGLYACGEVLDIDGDCGGYNLQWAWASGRLAGLSAAGGELS